MQSHYRSLLVMAGLSFSAMYVLMYAMVDSVTNVYANINQAYMAGLMTAPMVMIELLVMRTMYRDRRITALIMVASALGLVACFIAIQTQAGVRDEQFLRSMIPHHAAAILMCEQASLQDRDIQALCQRIQASQQSEIEQMKAKLQVLDR